MSAETPVSATNGHGPYEVNTSNGEAAAGDGRPLTIAGSTWATGLGVHAPSTLTFNIGAQCKTFTAEVGIDDEVGNNGSVTFKVYADDRLVAQTPELYGYGGKVTLSANIEGAERLRLVAEQGTNLNYDHADWADAKLLNCVTYQPPLVINPSGTGTLTVTGNYKSTSTGTPAILVKTTQPVVIENCTVAGPGYLVRAQMPGTQITIRRCRGYGLNPNVAPTVDPTTGKVTGVSPERFASIDDAKSVTIENNFMKNTAGIYIQGSGGNPTGIKIVTNDVLNIEGRFSDGNYGWYPERDGDNIMRVVYHQFVQLSNLVNIPNIEVAYNRVVNNPNESRVEDNINLHNASGTAASRIRIHHNLIRGAYSFPANLNEFSGGGIITDYCSNGTPNRYIDIADNTILNTSNYGAAMNDSEYTDIHDNKIYNTGAMPNQTPQVPVAGDDNGIYAQFRSVCGTKNYTTNNVHHNSIGFNQPTFDGEIRRHDLYIGDPANPNAVQFSNTFEPTSTPINDALINQKANDWQTYMTNSNLTVGP